jgi:uncharacterized protein YndB with AHSA1/START domain
MSGAVLEQSDDVRRSLTIAAPPAAVYAALVQPEGLRGWWSTHAEVATEAGGLTRFVWSDTDYTTFRVDRLIEPARIDWTCVGQHDSNLPKPDEWVGTTVSFCLTDEEGNTRLDFVHRGLAPLECGDVCSGGWDFFLHRSLKSLVETGHGLPWQP